MSQLFPSSECMDSQWLAACLVEFPIQNVLPFGELGLGFFVKLRKSGRSSDFNVKKKRMCGWEVDICLLFACLQMFAFASVLSAFALIYVHVYTDMHIRVRVFFFKVEEVRRKKITVEVNNSSAINS